MEDLSEAISALKEIARALTKSESGASAAFAGQASMTTIPMYLDRQTGKLRPAEWDGEIQAPAGTAGTHNLLSTTHPDTVAGTVVRGDIITGQTATAAWTRLALGASGKILRSDGTDLAYSTATYPNTITQNALLYGTGTNQVGELGVPNVRAALVSGGAGAPVWSTSFTAGAVLIGSDTQTPQPNQLTGTANQLVVTNGSGTITLSTPQNTHTTATPTFASLTLTAASSLTLGTASSLAGSIVFKNATNANTATLLSGVSASNFTLTLPTGAGSNLQVLQTDGMGVLSWATVDIGFAAPPANSVGIAAPAAGVATTAARSDATFQLSQAIAPTWTGAHTYQHQKFFINNPANTFAIGFEMSAEVAARTLTFPLMGGARTVPYLERANTFTAAQTVTPVADGGSSLLVTTLAGLTRWAFGTYPGAPTYANLTLAGLDATVGSNSFIASDGTTYYFNFQTGGSHIWRLNSGSEFFKITTGGVLFNGATAVGTSGVGNIGLASGTAPTTSPAAYAASWVQPVGANLNNWMTRNEAGLRKQMTGLDGFATGDVTVANATLVDLTGTNMTMQLLATPGAYKIEADLAVTLGATLEGIKVTMVFSSVPTNFFADIEIQTQDATPVDVFGRITTSGGTPVGLTVVGTPAVTIRIRGFVETNAATTVKIQFAKNASTGATLTTVLRGSTLNCIGVTS